MQIDPLMIQEAINRGISKPHEEEKKGILQRKSTISIEIQEDFFGPEWESTHASFVAKSAFRDYKSI